MSTMADRPPAAAPVGSGEDYRSITDQVSAMVLTWRGGWRWWALFGFFLAGATVFLYALGYLFVVGVGIWGIGIPVAWGFAITNYVWWIGIGMSGTFISAALLLLRQGWRTSINRYAEAMTVFAVAIAGLFPVMHLGRPWFFYWLMPYPNIMNLWPQWRSALDWDFFAVLSYLIVSVIFWYHGMIPDLGTLRDRAATRRGQRFYGLLALGWRGDARHWQHHETATRLLAGLAIPLVFSVHSEVAFDFSIGALPGWHLTLFPPYFVAGALYSGFALAMVMAVPLRAVFGLQHLITARHLDHLAKATLAVGLVVAYSYVMESFMTFYSGDEYEVHLSVSRATGSYAGVFWATLFCNVLALQALWFRRVRASPGALLVVGSLIVAGMWLERFVIVIISLASGDFLPSAWGTFYPTLWDWAHLLGSVCLFVVLFLLFLRLLPAVSMYEMRSLITRLHKE